MTTLILAVMGCQLFGGPADEGAPADEPGPEVTTDTDVAASPPTTTADTARGATGDTTPIVVLPTGDTAVVLTASTASTASTGDTSPQTDTHSGGSSESDSGSCYPDDPGCPYNCGPGEYCAECLAPCESDSADTSDSGDDDFPCTDFGCMPCATVC